MSSAGIYLSISTARWKWKMSESSLSAELTFIGVRETQLDPKQAITLPLRICLNKQLQCLEKGRLTQELASLRDNMSFLSIFNSRVHCRRYMKTASATSVITSSGAIVKPWKFDHNTKRIFTVLDALDLNSMPNMMMPSGANGNKTLCCWCCQSGPIEVEFHSDRSGYVPGEWISVNATLNNSTNSKVEATSVHLMQKVTYHATSKTKSVWKTLATLHGPNCDKHKSIMWNNERLQIPPVPPSESNHCQIIDISYFLVFEGHLRTCAVNLREYAPLTIGTIPLQSVVHPDGMGMTPMPSAPPAAQPMAAPSAPQAYGMSAPPPSYAAATGESLNVNVKDDDDNEYTMGDTSYTPQYTFYDWNQSAFTYNK